MKILGILLAILGLLKIQIIGLKEFHKLMKHSDKEFHFKALGFVLFDALLSIVCGLYIII